MIWTNEREVRKVIQNYVKKVLDQCDNTHIDKITNSSKGLEAEVVRAMTNKLSPTAVWDYLTSRIFLLRKIEESQWFFYSFY